MWTGSVVAAHSFWESQAIRTLAAARRPPPSLRDTSTLFVLMSAFRRSVDPRRPWGSRIVDRMSRDVPRLSDADWRRIAEALVAWSEAHPRPHLPVVQLADTSELTPFDIGLAIRDIESGPGQLLYRVFAASQIDEDSAPAEPIDEILADFERDTRAWRFGENRG